METAPCAEQQRLPGERSEGREPWGRASRLAAAAAWVSSLSLVRGWKVVTEDLFSSYYMKRQKL